MNAFKEELSQTDWRDVLLTDDIDASCESFFGTINRFKEKYTKPFKNRQSKGNLPWFNDHLCDLMKKRDFALKVALKSKLITDRQIFTNLRNKVVNELRKAKAKFFMDIIKDGKGNSKLIWSNINKLIKKDKRNQRNGYELKINGILNNDPSEIASVFNTYFTASVQNLSDTFGARSKNIVTPDYNKTIFKVTEVSEDKICKTLSTLKFSKAKDIFNWDSTFLKNNIHSLSTPITHLVNLSVKQSIFPNSWKDAVLVPIFKAGELTDVANYRPISILPVISKITEKVVTEQLTDFLNSEQILHPMQFGFRKNYSTEMATCYFVEKIKLKLDNGSAVGAVFLDLKKAFDTVNYNVLLSKLSNLNFSDTAMKWMESYLTIRRHSTRVGNKMSSFSNCTVGVPQGSVLGPLLFSLYVNDLPLVCPQVDTLMYADDTVILAHGRDRHEVANKLTVAMAKIATWLSGSCMTLNVSKTVCLYFSIRKNENQPDVVVNGENIRVVTF